MRRILWLIATALFFTFTSKTLNAQLTPGGLDGTFGTNGVARSNAGNEVRGIAIQPDGKIVAVSHQNGQSPNQWVVIRYNANGTLDNTFNGTGIFTRDGGLAYAVALQPDGKIVVGGTGSDDVFQLDFTLIRLNANGTPDNTFDGDGMVTTPVGPGIDVLYQLAVQPDGKILASGRVDSNPVFVTSYGMVRYNADGSLDTGFDGDGKVIVPGPGNSISDGLVLQPDGKIVVAHNYYAAGEYVLRVLRYLSNGTLDPTFDGDGIADMQVGTNVEYVSATLQRDGKIVVACSSYTSDPAGYDFWVVRLSSNGAVETTFGTNGRVVTPIGAGSAFDEPMAVSIQANGKIVVVGRTRVGSVADLVIARYNRNGSLDIKFGNNGIVRTDLGGSFETLWAVAIQPNGRIVAGGLSSGGSGFFLVLRNNGDHAENADFDRDGNADISVYRPSDGMWWIRGSSFGLFGAKWGIAGDRIASADFDGDLRVDIAVWRSGSPATLYILNSSTGTFRSESFGEAGDDPSVIGDYDGDGRADPAVYRNVAAGQQSYFFYRGSFNNPGGSTTYVPWGTGGDIAVRGDLVGNSRIDPTVFRPSSGTWHTLDLANNSVTTLNWGLSTDRLVPADYDGDGKTDRALYRNGLWHIMGSRVGVMYLYWGLATDLPVPADYDGDGSADAAVYRAGTWYIRQSGGGNAYIPFGLPADVPTPTGYLP